MIQRKLNPYLAVLFITIIASGVAYALLRQSYLIEDEEIPSVILRRRISSTTADSMEVSPGAPDTAETPDDTAVNIPERKTYRNEEYGFEMKYPGDWSVASNSVHVLLDVPNVRFSKGSFGLNVFIQPGPVELETEEEVTVITSEKIDTGTVFLDKTIYKGTKGYWVEALVLKREETSTETYFIFSDTATSVQEIAPAEQIILTLKFTK